MRGGKHSIFQGGFKVPFIVRWPDVAKAGTTCDAMISLVDVYATLADMLQVTSNDQKMGPEDSVSFLQQLKDPAAKGSRTSMILHSAIGVFAIRKDQWKFIEGKPHPRCAGSKYPDGSAGKLPQLYNLQKDPKESENLLKQNPQQVEALRAELEAIRGKDWSVDSDDSASGTDGDALDP